MAPWTSDEVAVLHSAFGAMSAKDVAALLPGRTPAAVANKAASVGLKTIRRQGQRYTSDDSFFDVPGVVNSFWAGFIAADGCVRDNQLIFGVHVRDSCHLERFRAAVGYTGQVSVGLRKATLSLRSGRLVRALELNYRVTPSKSLTLQPPPLPVGSPAATAFIAGLIDGDGSITQTAGVQRLTVYGTKAVLGWVGLHFNSWSPPWRRAAVEHKVRGANLHKYAVGSGRAVACAATMLGLGLPCLDRKWGLARRWLE